jgi:preprotein translocase subunit SecY
VSNGIFTALRGVTAPDALAVIGESGRFGAVMTLLGALAFLLALIWLLASVQGASLSVGVLLPEGGKASLPLRLMPAGIVPTQWTASLLMIPFTVMQFSTLELPRGLMASLLPGGFLHAIAELVLIVLLSLAFTSLFHRVPRMAAELEERGARFEAPGGESPVEYLDRRLLFLALGGGLFLGFFVLAGNAAYRFGGYAVGAVSVLVLVAIALDLYGEGRLRLRHGTLVRVAELHDVNKAALLEDILRRRGIPCMLRGGHHRGLLYFFGPFVEMSLLVPEKHGEEAARVVEGLGGGGVGSALDS